MPTANAITSFVRRPTAADMGLIVEQMPWPKGTGRVGRLQLILAAAARLFGLEPPEIDCGIDANGFDTAVYVYPYDPALAYSCGVTHGNLAETPMRAMVEKRQYVSFSMTTEEPLDYPMQDLVSLDWVDDEQVWAASGAVLTKPVLSAEIDKVRSAVPVYGTALCVYKTMQITHSLQVPPREDAVENVFQSAFWAAWNGGVKLLEIEPPEGAEEDYQLDTRCTGGSDVNLDPDDPDKIPPVPTIDREITLDYCEDFN